MYVLIRNSLNGLADSDVDGETCVKDGMYDSEGCIFGTYRLTLVFDDGIIDVDRLCNGDGLEMGDITV